MTNKDVTQFSSVECHKELNSEYDVEFKNEFDSIERLLDYAYQQQASDIHLSAGMPAMMRKEGEMMKFNMPSLAHSEVQHFIYATMTASQRTEFESCLELDYAFDIPDLARFRVNAFHQNLGAAAVFRIIPSKILSLSELGLDSSTLHQHDIQHTSLEGTFKRIASFARGLVLITGPTGSGKSTTQAALIDYINNSRKAHILTIEDPIEFIHQSKLSLINQREVSRHTLSFESALRSALREDPDVILVGELRDLETIRLALTAAETGHLVFATLHTSSAVKTIDRIIDVFPAAEKDMIRALLSESLQAVISQTLVKSISSGRVAAHEIMIATPAIRNLIRQNKLAQMYSAIQTGGQHGMTTLDDSLKTLINLNIVTKEHAQRHAKQPDSL